MGGVVAGGCCAAGVPAGRPSGGGCAAPVSRRYAAPASAGAAEAHSAEPLGGFAILPGFVFGSSAVIPGTGAGFVQLRSCTLDCCDGPLSPAIAALPAGVAGEAPW